MRPARWVLGAVGFVLFPAFAAGAITFTVIDRVAARLAKGHPQLDAGIASEAASWLAIQGETA